MQASKSFKHGEGEGPSSEKVANAKQEGITGSKRPLPISIPDAPRSINNDSPAAAVIASSPDTTSPSTSPAPIMLVTDLINPDADVKSPTAILPSLEGPKKPKKPIVYSSKMESDSPIPPEEVQTIIEDVKQLTAKFDADEVVDDWKTALVPVDKQSNEEKFATMRFNDAKTAIEEKNFQWLTLLLGPEIFYFEHKYFQTIRDKEWDLVRAQHMGNFYKK